jgi:hypothetical protein
MAEKEGIKVNKVDDLSSVNNSSLTIIVPTGPVNTDWGEIKKYINENPKTQILVLDLSTSKSELEKLIGKNENVENLITQETRMEFTYDKIFDKLGIN